MYLNNSSIQAILKISGGAKRNRPLSLYDVLLKIHKEVQPFLKCRMCKAKVLSYTIGQKDSASVILIYETHRIWEMGISRNNYRETV